MTYQLGTSVFKDWIIRRELGEGAYGKVFEIQKNNFGITTTSALKVLQIPKSQSDVEAAYSEGMDELSVTGYFQECVERLVREIAILSELKSHPHIVGYEDHDVIQRTDVFGWDILIRMELLTSLQAHQRTHTLTEADMIQLGKDMCSALSFCHKKGLIHRDIKPANIFLNELGQYKLGDFGVSRNMEGTVSNMSKAGTESYMAPEVYFGRPYSPNVDLYSLGLVLFQLANNGRLPFLPPAPQPMRFSDREKALHHRLNGEPMPTPAGVSVALADVIRKACAYDPKDRYQTADEMMNALAQIGHMPAHQPQKPQHTYESFSSQTKSQTDVDPEDQDLTERTYSAFGSAPAKKNTKEVTRQWEDEVTDEFEEKTEATVSVFGGRNSQAKKPGSVSTSQSAAPQSAKQNTSAQTTTASQTQSSNRTATRPGKQTPIVYFDHQLTDITKKIARKNVIPGQAEVWVTRNLMNGLAMGSFPGLHLSFFFNNGICWKFTGDLLKNYMIELQKAVNNGFHTITIINRFPELRILQDGVPKSLQETIYLHLKEIQGNDAHTAMYDGVSGLITRLGASGQWVGNQNVKPQFYSDGACSNPFYGTTSFLYQPPKRVRITSALAEVGTNLVMSGFGEPKKVMMIPPLAPNAPSYLSNMTEELQKGHTVNIAEFFRVEAIVPSNKPAIWLPDDGVIYTAMMKSSAKEGKMTKVERRQSKYASLKTIFE
ncbi:MAG: serine/threonine protein kinase [Lachnospiraceae bacterium]|nr:serine/threonine protein kinase [Lachnospiraceae bacterium]